MFKIELATNGYSVEVTSDLVNWDDVLYSLKRIEYSGVSRSFSSKFSFTGKAYSILKTEYVKNYLQSKSSVVLYTLNNSRLWMEEFRCALDFSTLSDDGNIISINAIDNNLASLINSKKGVIYDIPVSDVSDELPLFYDRLEMKNSSNWVITGDIVKTSSGEYVENTFDGLGGQSQTVLTIPIYVEKSEILIKNIIEIYDVSKRGYPTNSDYEGRYFLKNISGKDIDINIKLNLEIIAEIKGEGVSNIRIESLFPSKVLFYKPLKEGLNTIILDETFTIKAGSIVYFAVMTATQYTKLSQEIRSDKKQEIQIVFPGIEKPINIAAITPINLLNSILKSINSGKDDVSGEIVSDPRLDKTYIIASESIRGIKDAKIHTSYDKFAKWMSSVFGYVPFIEGNKVTFKHRDSFYTDAVGKYIGQDFKEFDFSVDNSMIYSSVKVGYEKIDYDSVNGRDEFRFTNEFTTGVTLTTNTFSLISPYRADAYGIEFLAQKRGEDTTDNNSDNDVFFVGAKLVKVQTMLPGNVPVISYRYELIRGGDYILSGVISPETMFNAMYSPRYMIEANKLFIGAFSDNLVFASSEGNSDVVINNIPEKNDFPISGRLFKAEKCTIVTSDLNIPVSMRELISLNKNGKEYRGYIESVTYNLGKPEEVKYNLIIEGIYENS